MIASLLALCLIANVAAQQEAQDPPAAEPTTRPAWREAKPSPDLSPQQVVEVVIEALAANGEDDAGIRKTFEFASPGNRQQTGPIERFIPLVKQPPYDVMLGSAQREMGPFREIEGVAEQAVRVVGKHGRTRVFIFRVSRQAGGEYDGCWMTDGVVPVELAPPAPRRGGPV